MAASNYTDHVEEMVRGDTHKVRFTVRIETTLAATDITSWTAFRFTAKDRLTDADGAAILSKTLGSGITKSDAANGVIEVVINPADTASLAFQKYDLKFDVQGVDGSGQNWTLIQGVWIIWPDASRTSP